MCSCIPQYVLYFYHYLWYKFCFVLTLQKNFWIKAEHYLVDFKYVVDNQHSLNSWGLYFSIRKYLSDDKWACMPYPKQSKVHSLLSALQIFGVTWNVRGSCAGANVHHYRSARIRSSRHLTEQCNLKTKKVIILCTLFPISEWFQTLSFLFRQRSLTKAITHVVPEFIFDTNVEKAYCKILNFKFISFIHLN